MILLLQVLKVMLMPSADYHSLQCASEIASVSNLCGYSPWYSTFQTKSEELPHISHRVRQGKKICRLKVVPVALSQFETQKRAFTLIFAGQQIVIYYVIDTIAQLINWTFPLAIENRFVEDKSINRHNWLNRAPLICMQNHSQNWWPSANLGWGNPPALHPSHHRAPALLSLGMAATCTTTYIGWSRPIQSIFKLTIWVWVIQTGNCIPSSPDCSSGPELISHGRVKVHQSFNPEIQMREAARRCTRGQAASYPTTKEAHGMCNWDGCLCMGYNPSHC